MTSFEITVLVLLIAIISLLGIIGLMIMGLVKPEHEEEKSGFIKPNIYSRKLKAYSPSKDITKIMDGEAEDQFS